MFYLGYRLSAVRITRLLKSTQISKSVMWQKLRTK